VSELSARAKDTLGLLLVGAGVIAIVLLLLLNLPLVIEALLLVIAVVLFAVAALAVVGVVAAVPLYFLKHGPTTEPANNYRLDDVRAVKEDEKK